MAAREDNNQQGTPVTQNTFSEGMFKDAIDLYKKTSTYTHALNASRNLPDGQLGALSTEPAFAQCVTFPYPLIGAIPLSEDNWCVFLTDDITWEIGTFIESQCSYTTLTGPQTTCPIFNREHLVIGAARRGFDCGYDVYWSTGRYSFDGFLNTAKVPFIQTCTPGPCVVCTDTTVIDCEKLRLSPHFVIPCLKLSKGEGSGQLLNGSYQVAIRYAINSIPCTDFIALSNIESIWAHNNLAGAVKLAIVGAETNIFQEMEVVLVSMTNQQVEARSLGIYSTSQSNIYIDNVDQTLQIVPLDILPLSTPAIEKSDAIYSVANYLLRVGPQTKPEPNYQPFANNIRAWWTCVEYNDQYYHRGGDQYGMNVGHMRDEVYAYYIRWVWLSGDKTSSYHIPGVPTGTLPSFIYGGPSTGDTGVTIAHGRMGGYSSTEIYPDHQPAVWGPLCGLPIMHHRFPDQTLHPELTHFTSYFTIRVMGVYFDNIALPVDNNGNILSDIQGFEILRAVREGHKSVIAKGQVNHMRGATDTAGTVTSVYQNYPYDDLGADRYLTTSQTIGTVGGTVDGYSGNEQTMVMSDIISFHSPDTTFNDPNLGGSGTLKLYQYHTGTAEGSFNIPYKHPKVKLLTDRSSELGIAIGVIAILSEAFNVISGGGTNLSLPATEAIPWTTPMGMSAIAQGTAGAVSDAIYIAGVAANAIALTLMIPIKLKAIQSQIMALINGLSPSLQYARQYDSHGFYNTPGYLNSPLTFTVNDYQYVKGQVQTFAQYTINNLYRNQYLALQLSNTFPTTYPGGAATVDRSRFTLGQSRSYPGVTGGGVSGFGPWYSPIVSWYGAYKVPQNAQYGQVDSGKEVPISCTILVDPTSAVPTYTSPVLFGGDTYINRYTEKNAMMFFNDWLLGQENDYPYDYTTYENVGYPRYWINSTKVFYDKWGFGPGSGASKNWHVDEPDLGTIIFGIGLSFYLKGGYFYLFNNGVRDFYVESEVNVGYRDWEDDFSKRFYDPYAFTSLDYIFRSDIIQSDVLYKYDYSLSASRFFNQYLSWGKMNERDYDPVLAYTCFSYYPRRINYSLPQDVENKKDNWRIFLANNYRDFNSLVTAIKEIHKSGALILFKDQPPQQFVGVDQLETTSGVKVTVGDGGLFRQSLESVSNADIALQYGSCQNRLSIVNTPHGVYWVSRDTGKVFIYTGAGMQDISPGLKWQLSRYLPSQLLQQFPHYPLSDNPLMGIGVQCVYDNTNEVLYICKKDYKALDTVNTSYIDGTGWIYNSIPLMMSLKVELTDSNYFEDCSWSLSYDCASKKWISYHSWIPALNIPAKTHPLLSNSFADTGKSLWRMNNRTDLFCNYFGVQYPFEVSYYAGIGSNENTLSSVEVISESYQYRANSTDRFQIFDHFFDEALVYNPEQNSYWLSLTIQPWDNPYATINYPFFTAGAYNTLYSKVENRYRLNTFYDFSDNRYQFGIGSLQAINTHENSYSFNLVNAYFNQLKAWNEQKRFRYRGTQIFLRKNNPGKGAISLIGTSSNNQSSLR